MFTKIRILLYFFTLQEICTSVLSQKRFSQITILSFFLTSPCFDFPVKVHLFQIPPLGKKLTNIVSRETHSCDQMEGIACVFKILVILNKVLTQACIAEGLFLSIKRQHKMRKLVLASFLLIGKFGSTPVFPQSRE